MTEKLSAEQIAAIRRAVEEFFWGDESRSGAHGDMAALLAHIDALQAENEALRATLRGLENTARFGRQDFPPPSSESSR